MTIRSDKPGAALAEQLIKQSERDGAITPMDAVIEAARAGNFTPTTAFPVVEADVDANSFRQRRR